MQKLIYFQCIAKTMYSYKIKRVIFQTNYEINANSFMQLSYINGCIEFHFSYIIFTHCICLFVEFLLHNYIIKNKVKKKWWYTTNFHNTICFLHRMIFLCITSRFSILKHDKYREQCEDFNVNCSIKNNLETQS